MEQFEEELKSILVSKYTGVNQGIMPEGYLEAPLAYDAIWAVALGKAPFKKTSFRFAYHIIHTHSIFSRIVSIIKAEIGSHYHH